jgi:hypothetical protein
MVGRDIVLNCDKEDRKTSMASAGTRYDSLSDLNVSCPDGKGISNLKLNMEVDGRYYYTYKCCTPNIVKSKEALS